MVAAKDYRSILKQELETRSQRNRSYSLRAFARHLGLSSARLSEILNGKQGLSTSWAEKIAHKLGYSADERSLFCDLVEAEHSRSKLKRRLAQVRLAQHPKRVSNTLQMDAFQVISDWYHFAILELTLIKGFKSDTGWIARKLGINRALATLAVERLLRLELLEKRPDGTLIAKDDFTASPDGVPSEAIKKYHQQVLEKALSGIYTQSVEQRDFSNMILAFDRAQIQDAKKLIREFRRSFSKKLEPTATKDSVYCLAIQFFQLDQDVPGTEAVREN